MVLCPHGGNVSIVSTNMRVKVSGQPVATLSDIYTVAGCPLASPAGTPLPCLRVQWIVPAQRVKVNGTPVIIRDSIGISWSADSIPLGPPNVTMTQFRVKGM
jgi:uncharacterized Zn-binding protein involved in type VI secretion